MSIEIIKDTVEIYCQQNLLFSKDFHSQLCCDKKGRKYFRQKRNVINFNTPRTRAVRGSI